MTKTRIQQNLTQRLMQNTQRVMLKKNGRTQTRTVQKPKEQKLNHGTKKHRGRAQNSDDNVGNQETKGQRIHQNTKTY